MKKKKASPLLAGKAEVQAENIKSLLANPAYKAVLGRIIADGILRAERAMFEATSQKVLWKALGELKALRGIEEVFSQLVKIGEMAGENRRKELSGLEAKLKENSQ